MLLVLALPIALLSQAGSFTLSLPNAIPISASNPGYLITGYSAADGLGTLQVFLSYDAKTFFFKQFPTWNCYGNTRGGPSSINYGGTYLYATTTDGSGSCVSDLLAFATSANDFAFSNNVGWNCNADVPGAVHCWAPEWFADPNACTYNTNGSGWSCTSLANLHLYYAASATGVCCSGFAVYERHPTASDFMTNMASWSTSVLITVTGENDDIDPFMTCRNSTTGANCSTPLAMNDTYYLWYNSKNTPAAGCINEASNTAPTGTFTRIIINNCFGYPSYVEAPAVLHVVNGSPGTWRVYMDWYQNTDNLGQVSFVDTTDNFSTFTNASNIFTPMQTKHSTIIPYP